MSPSPSSVTSSVHKVLYHMLPRPFQHTFPEVTRHRESLSSPAMGRDSECLMWWGYIPLLFTVPHCSKYHPEYTSCVFSIAVETHPGTVFINAYGFLEKMLKLLRYGLELAVPLGCLTSPGDLPDSASPVLGLRGPTPMPRIFYVGSRMKLRSSYLQAISPPSRSSLM